MEVLVGARETQPERQGDTSAGLYSLRHHIDGRDMLMTSDTLSCD
jgi:hypothetical protein